MCRMWWFLAVLRCFFHSSLLREGGWHKHTVHVHIPDKSRPRKSWRCCTTAERVWSPTSVLGPVMFHIYNTRWFGRKAYWWKEKS
jgi:hypothetical protein